MSASMTATTLHPAWCNKEQHRRFVEESEGLLDPAEVTAHQCHGGNAALSELVNPVSGRAERDGGGSWALTAHQRHQAPYTDAAGYAGPPLVELRTAERGASQTRLDMTTGEARVLAAHLIALCDRVDLADVLAVP